MLIVPKIRFTDEQMITMLRLQAEANDAMSTDWRFSTNKEIAYYRASYMEAVEAINWHGFKWWKKQDPDVKQMEMELIDILHFALSDIDRTGYVSRLIPEDFDWELNTASKNLINSFQDDSGVKVLPVGSFSIINDQEPDEANMGFIELCEQFAYECLDSGITPFTWLRVLFDKLQMTNDYVFSLYVGKNVLNKFRTKHGQKENKYVKIWDDGREDNEHLMSFINFWLGKGEAINEEDVWDFLEITYRNKGRVAGKIIG